MTISRLLQDKENYTNEISLLVSILLRYPQISSLNFDPHLHMLRFAFMVSENIPEEQLREFQHRLETSLEAFHHLDDHKEAVFEIVFKNMNAITCIEISRHLENLSQEEISLIVMLLQDAFSNHLVMDFHDSALDEDLQLQEELIDTMLLDLKDNTKDRNFIAYREEGRVMVFNK